MRIARRFWAACWRPPEPRSKPANPNLAPAHAIWVELATRISTQPLHYRSGEEETAADSIYKLFAKTRDLMAAHPKATAFNQLSLELLNGCLRPYTARWHGWMTDAPKADGKPQFRTEVWRHRFRAELLELQPKLRGFQAAYKDLADGMPLSGGQGQPQATRPAKLGAELIAEINPNVPFKTSAGTLQAQQIDAAEHVFIAARRNPGSSNSTDNPPRITDAIGLALSGGGIRSATVCLGVVQSLAKHNLLAQVDYLSTVSGGGYLGSFLSSFFHSSPPEQSGEVFRQDLTRNDQGLEPAAVRHLRNNSKYLLHGGAWGKLQIAGLFLSGLAGNILMVLALPLIASLVLFGLYWAGFWGSGRLFQTSPYPAFGETGAARWLIGVGLLLACSWFTLTVVRRCTSGRPIDSPEAKFRGSLSFFTLGLLLACSASVALYLVPGLFWIHHLLSVLHRQLKIPNVTLTTLISALPFLSALGTAVLRPGRLRRFLAQLFVLSGPLLYVWTILVVGTKLGIGHGGHYYWNWMVVALITVALFVWSFFLVDINSGGPHGYYRDRLCECFLAARGNRKELTWWQTAIRRWWSGREHPHQTGHTNNAVGNLLQLPLTQLATPGAAPYHLINTVVNLSASANPDLRGRDGDFFLLSPNVCGSPICGYVPTRDLIERDPHIDLGTAMAISGAAAAPNMGWRTLPNFRFLMTLFNVRLGYWIPNVARLGEVRGRGVGFPYLWCEMTGLINENLRFLNLSDGGHIENSGAYELIRRKCKFIICVDGGAALGTERSDLQRLERLVGIDFGIRLEYDLTDLQPDSAKQARAYAILVKILYSAGEIGWMIYLKPAITGGEPPFVLDFRCLAPEFPFEGLLDQAYSEERFEAYRALGGFIAESLFRDELMGGSEPGTVQEWFQRLANNLLPDNDKAFKDPPAVAAPAPV